MPTTSNKDFKVKNGLVVGLGGTFGGPVEVGEPTETFHATTKEYVDSVTNPTTFSETAPLYPSNGDNWFDTTVDRLKIYYNGAWTTQATIDDVQNIPDHIHDTAIDGTGQVVTIFWDGQWYNSPQLQSLDGGSYDSVTWDFVFDGGNPTSNFV